MRRMLEFTLADAPAGRHRMVTPGRSSVDLADNGSPPPARLLIMWGAMSDRSIPVTVLEVEPLTVRLPGSGAVLTFSAVDRPIGGPARLLLVPICGLPDGVPVPTAEVHEMRSVAEAYARERHPTGAQVA